MGWINKEWNGVVKALPTQQEQVNVALQGIPAMLGQALQATRADYVFGAKDMSKYASHTLFAEALINIRESISLALDIMEWQDEFLLVVAEGRKQSGDSIEREPDGRQGSALSSWCLDLTIPALGVIDDVNLLFEQDAPVEEQEEKAFAILKGMAMLWLATGFAAEWEEVTLPKERKLLLND